MNDILPSCDAAQLKEIFGPVGRYVVELEGVGAGVTLSASGDELIQELFAA